MEAPATACQTNHHFQLPCEPMPWPGGVALRQRLELREQRLEGGEGEQGGHEAEVRQVAHHDAKVGPKPLPPAQPWPAGQGRPQSLPLASGAQPRTRRSREVSLDFLLPAFQAGLIGPSFLRLSRVLQVGQLLLALVLRRSPRSGYASAMCRR